MTPPIPRLGSMRDVKRFQAHIEALGVSIPCQEQFITGSESPLAKSLERGGFRIGNRIAVQPMEGWDGTLDGKPTESTIRRWKRFGRSGAKLIWGGEAVAVSRQGRANPNQLVAATHTGEDLAHLRAVLLEEHRQTAGSDAGLLIGLQLTHSGRFCRPNPDHRPVPRILHRHPILDGRLKLPADYPLLTDGEIQRIIEDFHRAARIAWEMGFHFVDVKHCHGYLGHEFLGAHTREGGYGGSFENRTRFLREVVEGIRSHAPGLKIGVRLSAFDTVPFRPDPKLSTAEKLGPGIAEDHAHLLPYHWGFGLDQQRPTEPNLAETFSFIELLQKLGITLVNLTAGSPYYNPHVQRPALYPPSDGYMPPEDPLMGVARQMQLARAVKDRFPGMIFVGSGYSYLQEFLPNVAQAAIHDNWIDCVGLGRMVLTYPEQLWDAVEGAPTQRKRICRTFSDCTTAPRNGLPSGCYPLDSYYKDSEPAQRLKQIKARAGVASTPTST